MNDPRFKHKTQVRVRNFEIDWQGIVHNANYLHYFEIGRIEYLKDVGIQVDLNTIRADSKIVLARNEVDYKVPAKFDDLLDVYTRISYIRNTSFAFEGVIEKAGTAEVIALNRAIHVWLQPRTWEPIPVSDVFKKCVRKFEGDDLEILDQTRLA